MSEIPTKPPVDEDSIKYGARTKLASLALEISEARKLSDPKIKAKIKQAKQIRIWLKALDFSYYLSREQREKIWYALIHIAEINDFPIAPLLASQSRPAILMGQGNVTNITNNYTGSGTNVSNSDVDAGTEVIDSFAFSLATAVVWHYEVTNGTSSRSGIFTTTWLSSGASISDGAEYSSPDIGDTSDVVLSCDISGGLVRLKATAASNNWAVNVTRYLING